MKCFALKSVAETTGPALLALVFLACRSPAEDSKPAEKDTKTKLEAFEAKTGTVLIKGFEGIGSVGSIAGMGQIMVACREFTDAASGHRERGITIEVIGAGRLAHA